MTEGLLTAAQVAEMLHVPERWVRDHTRSGSIPCVRLGRYVRYRRERVLDWLEAQEAASAVRGRPTPVRRGGTK